MWSAIKPEANEKKPCHFKLLAFAAIFIFVVNAAGLDYRLAPLQRMAMEKWCSDFNRLTKFIDGLIFNPVHD